MRINTLKLVHFRNHIATTLDFSKKINFIVGPNASGKSSVVDALAFLLTGTTMRTTKSGEGMQDMVTFGESHGLVSADIGGVGKVTRSIPHDLQVEGAEGGITAQTTYLYNKLRLDKERILCSIYGSYFLDMTPSEQKTFIFDLVGVKVNADTVLKELKEWCQMNALDESVSARILETVRLMSDFATHDSLDDVYEQACTERKSLKKLVKNLEVLVKNSAVSLPDGISISDRDAVEKKLADLKAERDKLMMSISEASSKMTLMKSLEDTIALEKTIPKVTNASSTELDSLMKEVSAQIARLTEEQTTMIAKKKAAQAIIDSLKKFDGSCPLSTSIKCKMTQEDVQELRDQNQKTIGSAEAHIAQIETKIKELRAKYDEYHKIRITQQQYESLIPKIEQAKRQLAELKSQPMISVAEATKKLSVVDERINKGQNILAVILGAINAEKMKQINEDKLKESTEKLTIIEHIANAFGPKGIKSLLLLKAISPLEKVANERLKVLTNGIYSIRFRITDDDFEMIVSSNNVDRKLKDLSSSERWRIGLILQDAINTITKSKLLIADNADILDEDNRKLFVRLIETIAPTYDTIIVLAASSAKRKSSTNENINYIDIDKSRQDGSLPSF